MKKITILIALITLFSYSSSAQTCGTFSVTLEDSWIGGWEGGFLNIYINGSLFQGNVTQTSSNNPVTVQIPVNINDIISFDYTAGSNASENMYTVYNQLAVQVAVEGTGLNIPGDIGVFSIPTGLIACQTTGINTQSKNVDLTIFPNPSNGIFNLNINTTTVKELEIKVLNSIGQVVFAKNNFNNIVNINEQIDLSNNASGIYFVTVTTEKSITTQKLIIQ